jgi:hypothetical protein
MTVGKALYGLLNNDADITAVVLGKIYPEIAPADAVAPYIVYSIVSNTPSDIKEDGGSVDTAQIEVYNFGTTYSSTVDLGVLVRGVLDKVNGTYGGVNIQSIKYNNEQMDVTPERDLWASIQDYQARIKL